MALATFNNVSVNAERKRCNHARPTVKPLQLPAHSVMDEPRCDLKPS